jgi:hypothetical protein
MHLHIESGKIEFIDRQTENRLNMVHNGHWGHLQVTRRERERIGTLQFSSGRLKPQYKRTATLITLVLIIMILHDTIYVAMKRILRILMADSK